MSHIKENVKLFQITRKTLVEMYTVGVSANTFSLAVSVMANQCLFWAFHLVRDDLRRVQPLPCCDCTCQPAQRAVCQQGAEESLTNHPCRQVTFIIVLLSG